MPAPAALETSPPPLGVPYSELAQARKPLPGLPATDSDTEPDTALRPAQPLSSACFPPPGGPRLAQCILLIRAAAARRWVQRPPCSGQCGGRAGGSVETAVYTGEAAVVQRTHTHTRQGESALCFICSYNSPDGQWEEPGSRSADHH